MYSGKESKIEKISLIISHALGLMWVATTLTIMLVDISNVNYPVPNHSKTVRGLEYMWLFCSWGLIGMYGYYYKKDFGKIKGK